MSFKEFIDLLCSHYGVSVYRLSKLCGIDVGSMNSFRGSGRLGMPSAIKLSKLLDCDVCVIPGTKYYDGSEFDVSDFGLSVDGMQKLVKNHDISVKSALENSKHIESFHRFKCPHCGLSVEFRVLSAGEDVSRGEK